MMGNNCKYCQNVCKLSKSEIAHGKHLENKTICSSCSVTKRRWKNKIEFVKLLGSKCSKCGWTGNPAGFQFHHIDPQYKKFEVNGNGLLLKESREEIKKCKLLCACCHIIEHSNIELITKMGLLVP